MSRNELLFAQANRHIPGGVNSPVRAFGGVGGTPRFFKKALGAYVWDEDDRRYIDYIGSWGPMIAGHTHPSVLQAITQAAQNGFSFGAPTAAEIELADLLCELVPSMDKVRLTSSGTEATMSAIRLARGYTGRDLIIKFEGCYHGHADSLLVKAGSGALTFGQPSSAGVPADVSKHTLVLSYNNTQQLHDTFAQLGSKIAAIIVEPVAGNMNLIAPTPDFLHTMRDLCGQYGAVLIFDEVMTGFRVALGGAQAYYGITPDLTTLGKVVGGGMPIGAFGGKAAIMDCIAPLGGVYQAGTLSGNPIAVAAGLATLKLIQAEDFYATLSSKTQTLAEGFTQIGRDLNIPLCAQAVGGMFGLYFSPNMPQSYADIQACDKTRFNAFFHAMLDAGVYLAPSAFEAGFVGQAHTPQDITDTLNAARRVLTTN